MVKKNIRDNVIYVSRGYDTPLQYGNTLHVNEMHWITRDPWPEQCDGVDIMFKTDTRLNVSMRN